MTCYRKKLFPEIVQPDRVLELGPLLDLVHPVHVVGVLAKLELDRVGEVVETELSGLPRKLPLLLLLALLFMVTMTLWFWSARRGRRNLDDDNAAIRHPRERFRNEWKVRDRGRNWGPNRREILKRQRRPRCILGLGRKETL